MGKLRTTGNSRTRTRLAGLPSGPSSLLAAMLATSPSWLLKLDDPSGSTAEDATPNNLDGTYTSVTLAGKAGPGGNYADFNGTTSRVTHTVPHITGSGLSGLALVYNDTAKATRTVMAVIDASYSACEYDFNVSGSNINFTVMTSAASTVRTKSAAHGMSLGAWYLIGFTVTDASSTSTITLTVNGVDMGGTYGAAGASGGSSGTVLGIGHRADGWPTSQNYGIDGGIAYAAMWGGVVLTPTQVTTIATAADVEGWW